MRARALVYFLEKTIASEMTQREGYTIIFDLFAAPFYINKEAQKLSFHVAQNAFPARVKSILIVDAPWWFGSGFAIIKHFVVQKMRERMHMIKRANITDYVTLDNLPTTLGGNILWNPTAVIQQELHSSVESSD